MSTTPFRTPQRKAATGTFGVPMFIPPTPMMQNLGYGTGVEVYRIERSPAAGGSTRSPWALKRVTRRAVEHQEAAAASYKQRLVDEANILRRLDHPNIIGFRGMIAPAAGATGAAAGRSTLAMEMCDASLGDLLERRHEDEEGALEATKIRLVCRDVSRALDYLHNRVRLLHADIKSYNVLVKADFAACKLCDFGVSLPLDKEGYVDVVAKPDARYVGTDLWSAPETLDVRMVSTVSGKADIFSLGLVIYECVALLPPHTSGMASEKEYDEEEEEDEEDDEEEEEEEDEFDPPCGTRPLVPQAEQLGDEYNVVMELFFVCTNEEPDHRPSAAELAKLLDDGGEA